MVSRVPSSTPENLQILANVGQPAETGHSGSDIDGAAEASWPGIPDAIRAGINVIPQPWEDLFGPLRAQSADTLVVIGQIGQSLDGRVATVTGHSHYISGTAGLMHLHRLRALVDAVVVGVGTALADDPQLTVRRVVGPHPARVIVDPRGRLPARARALAADGVRRIVVTCAGTKLQLPAGVEVLALPSENGRIAPAAILTALAANGLRRILVEGGVETVSGFLAARCLNRLHVLIAPIILGAGQPSLRLPPIDRLNSALRPAARIHRLGQEVLFDCDLSAELPLGRAKKSR